VFGDADFGPMQRRGGLAAIYAPELTHAALLDALQERRCYATTGARIAVAFAVDGAPMGSEVVGAGPATITLSVGGTAELAEVMVVRHTAAEGWTIPVVWMPGAATFEQSWVDEDTAADAIYYLHVLQTDQHHAWSSPVWVDRP